VPCGELAYHKQAELVGVGKVEVGRPGQPLVDRMQLVGLDAQAPIIDLDGEAVGDPPGPDLDPGAGGRGQRRVLDQLGQQVDHVRRGQAGHRVLGPGENGDPLVVLDLRHCSPDDVGDRHRLAPGAPRRRASKDDQALGVTPHPGGEVIKRKQVRQGRRVGGLLFQRVDQAQLTLQQRLVPPGQADEDLPDAVAQPRLAGRGGRSRVLQAGDGGLRTGDLGRLGAQLQRDFGGYHLLLSLAEPLHEPGHLLVGQVPGRRLQVGDVPRETAREETHQRHAGDDDGQADADDDHEIDDDLVVVLRGVGAAHRPAKDATQYQSPQHHQARDRSSHHRGECEPDRAAGATRPCRAVGTGNTHVATPGSTRGRGPDAMCNRLLPRSPYPVTTEEPSWAIARPLSWRLE